MITANQCAINFQELMQPCIDLGGMEVYKYHYSANNFKDMNFNYSCDPYNRVGLGVFHGPNTEKYKSYAVIELLKYWKDKGYK